MDQTILVNEQIAAGHDLLDRLAKNQFPVSAAWWAKTSDDGQWKLYLTSPTIQQDGLIPAYQTVNRTVREMGDQGAWVRQKITLLRSEEPMATAAVSISAKTDPARVTNYPGPFLGNVLVDDAVFYPRSAAVQSQAAH
jgi:hypothetical protein